MIIDLRDRRTCIGRKLGAHVYQAAGRPKKAKIFVPTITTVSFWVGFLEKESYRTSLELGWAYEVEVRHESRFHAAIRDVQLENRVSRRYSAPEEVDMFNYDFKTKKISASFTTDSEVPEEFEYIRMAAASMFIGETRVREVNIVDNQVWIDGRRIGVLDKEMDKIVWRFGEKRD